VTVAAFILVLFVLLPFLATRRGTDSRPGFSSPVDWRRIDS
jgi:hypothetical protein